MAVAREWWRREVLARRKANLEIRAKAVAATREYFGGQGFVEVETPCLQVSPGLEPHLVAFKTSLKSPFGEADKDLYLHTSPEFAMKKLLVGGMERIWQMARTFRNGERSPTHHPEFTMLEWYRAGRNLGTIMDDVEALTRAAALKAGVTLLRHGDKTADPFGEWQRLSVADAFAHYAGIDILATAPDPLAPDVALLATQARGIGISVSPTDRWDDIFFKIMLDRIEPYLGSPAPTLLHSWPASMAALARIDPADPRVAQRVEAYICGLELANGFGELTDASEQGRRFAADMDLKQALYGERYPIDGDFLAALAAGMPESAGIALGFDRLVMLLTGAADITEVLWAPVADPGR